MARIKGRQRSEALAGESPGPEGIAVAPAPTSRDGAASVARRPSVPPRRARARESEDVEPRSTRRPPSRTRPPPKPVARAVSPEECLTRAIASETARARGMWARRGLAARSRIDRTIQSMLLRQLYLTYLEQRSFGRAYDVAVQAVELDILPDVAHQDAARAAAMMGDFEAVGKHLRTAARISPPSRRAFHYWTLGGLAMVAGRYAEAIGALERAARWGTRDKPLYQAHLAVAQRAAGLRVSGLKRLYQRLSEVPAGQGYGRFVLGLLAVYRGRVPEATQHLAAFVSRTRAGRPTLLIALEGEVAWAERVLVALRDETG